MTSDAHRPTIAKFLTILLAAVVLIPVAFVMLYLARGEMANHEVRQLCATDGGIQIFERAQLLAGESLTPGPINWSSYDSGRRIGSHFHIITKHYFWYEYGYGVYKYVVEIERDSDKKTLGQRIWYTREGNPIFRGITCPNDSSDEELIAKTLAISTQ